jgi:hypothetical protein
MARTTYCRLALLRGRLNRMLWPVMRSYPWWVLMLSLLAATVPASYLSGCTPSVTEGGFDSPMAASRLYAIERAVKEGDTTKIRNIIEQLESDDPAVRMMAIEALHRLTQRTYGYSHDAPLLDRRAAVQRWRRAYESGELAEAVELRENSPASRKLRRDDDTEGARHG